MRAPILAGALALASAFPDYHDPQTAKPAVQKVGTLVERVPLITGAALNNYGELFRQLYTPPAGEAREYDQVVLEWAGSVKGNQFDRFGALWLGEVEILRTTTPEPSPEGINWHIERDLTEYGSIFFKDTAPDAKNATLSIPNTVDGTYTGVLFVNVTLAFYKKDAAVWAASAGGGEGLSKAPLITPLALPLSAGSPWDRVTVSGQNSGSYPVALSVTNARRVFVDVFASGHQCEEFWYTNLPDALAPSPQCNGGAFRLIEIRVDGELAGARFPFPVVYTGGINPLLWRPLTGIESFDVVPYRFDISAFAGRLNDGKEHTLSVRIIGNNEQGLWYVDPVLVVYPEETATAPLLGDAAATVANELDVSVTQSSPGAALRVDTATSAPYRFTVKGNAGAYESTVTYELASTNYNSFTGTLEVTGGHMLETIASVHGAYTRSSSNNFTYHVENDSKQDRTSIDLSAAIAPLSRGRTERFTTETGDAYAIVWDNAIASRARYNRTNGPPRVNNVQEAYSTESFTITPADAGGPCYDLTLVGVNGTLTDGDRTFTCRLPAGVKFCGQELCGRGFDGI